MFVFDDYTKFVTRRITPSVGPLNTAARCRVTNY